MSDAPFGTVGAKLGPTNYAERPNGLLIIPFHLTKETELCFEGTEMMNKERTVLLLPVERRVEGKSQLLEPALSTMHTPSPVQAQTRRSDCPMEGGTGLAPHPTDCSKFLNCWKGTAHTQQCGPGTLFNPQTLQCDFPYRVTCTLSASGSQGECLQK